MTLPSLVGGKRPARLTRWRFSSSTTIWQVFVCEFKIRAMAHQHASQDSEDLMKYKTCNICLWLKIRWLECYVLPHGI